MAALPKLALTRRYSCMYTPDIKKKNKKWHDGYVVFHHMNSKAILMNEQFVHIDECFFRIPGVQLLALKDVPNTVKLPQDLEVDFDTHLATIEELVYEEEKDISEIFTKKRKETSILDSIAGEDDQYDPRTTPAPSKRPAKRLNLDTSHTPSRPYLQSSSLAQPAHRPPASRTPASIGSARPLQFTPSLKLDNPRLPGPPSGRDPVATPISRSRLAQPRTVQSGAKSASNVASAMARNFATPKATTPFRAPSFVSGAGAGSPVASTSKKALGTTRPMSSLARQSLQEEWSEFTDKQQKAQEARIASAARQRKESEQERSARKRTMLQELGNQQETDIIPMNQTRRDGEAGDTASWMFD